jgi:hypothetical protein
LLQDPSEINEDNLNNIRRETSRHLRNKKREYLKEKIDELATNSRIRIFTEPYRRINYFRRRYQPRSTLVKDENGDLRAGSHIILSMWKNYFSLLLKVHRLSDSRQIEMHAAEPLVPDLSPFEVEIPIAKIEKL